MGEEQLIDETQLGRDEQLKDDELLTGDEQLAGDEQLTGEEPLIDDKQLTGEEQLIGDKQLMDDEQLTGKRDSERALQLLGRYSRWQLRSYVAFAVSFGVFFSWQVMSVVYVVDTPRYRCAVPANESLNASIPRRADAGDGDGDWPWESCTMFVNGTTNRTRSCANGFHYDPASGYTATVVTDFDMTCERAPLVEFSMTLESVGETLGVFVWSTLADNVGRRPVFLFNLHAATVLTFVTALSPNFAFYAALQFFTGFLLQGVLAPAAVMAMELFPAAQRTFAGNFIEIFWCFGLFALLPLIYFVRHWRHLKIAIGAPFVFAVLLIWLIDESVPWLIANNRKRECWRVLQKAARVSGIKNFPAKFFPDDELRAEDDERRATRALSWRGRVRHYARLALRGPPREADFRYGARDVMRSRRLRKYSIVLWYLWFFNFIGYVGLTLTITLLDGDRYVNFLLYSIVELPAYLIAWFAMSRFGRIPPLIFFHFLAGITLVANLYRYFWRPVATLNVLLSLCGKFAVSASWSILYVLSVEVYPTNIRSIGMGICQLSGRISGFIGPFLRTLSRELPWATPTLLGGLGIVAGVLSFLLPETRGRKLPETINEIEGWTLPEVGTLVVTDDSSERDQMMHKA